MRTRITPTTLTTMPTDRLRAFCLVYLRMQSAGNVDRAELEAQASKLLSTTYERTFPTWSKRGYLIVDL